MVQPGGIKHPLTDAFSSFHTWTCSKVPEKSWDSSIESGSCGQFLRNGSMQECPRPVKSYLFEAFGEMSCLFFPVGRIHFDMKKAKVFHVNP